MDFRMDYEYINACKVQSGLTNKAIALSKNLSESTVSRFFHGEIKSPDTELSAAIFDAIGASADRAFGLIKPIDQALTEPAPSIPAVVTDVMQAIPPLVNPQEVAQEVAKAVTESPLVPDPIDPHKLAQDIASCLPKPQPVECEHCRTAKGFESTISLQMLAVKILGGVVALQSLILLYLLLAK